MNLRPPVKQSPGKKIIMRLHFSPNSNSITPEGWTRAISLDHAAELLNSPLTELRVKLTCNNESEFLACRELLNLIKTKVKEGGFVYPEIEIDTTDNELRENFAKPVERLKFFYNNPVLFASNNPLKVYLDDERLPDDETWYLTETPEETIELLKTGRVNELSLDNDLGLPNDEGKPERDGYSVCVWLEEQVFVNRFTPPQEMKVHSANAVASERMRVVIEKIL
ncbi:MAG: hypothetical protein FMNOHCHN_02031 [Ignavibacteriaceae bacterium]|nr:hypothetical protein [Ignavibacteriaceae bacterium]